MNVVLITGIVEQSAAQTKPGSDYGKMRLSVAKFNGQRDTIEIVAKLDKIETYGEGDMVAIRGSISGQVNDRGYVNLSIFLDQIEGLSVDSGTDSGYNEPPRQSSPERRPAPARKQRPSAYRQQDDFYVDGNEFSKDIPF